MPTDAEETLDVDIEEAPGIVGEVEWEIGTALCVGMCWDIVLYPFIGAWTLYFVVLPEGVVTIILDPSLE